MAPPSSAEISELDIATRLDLIEELWDSIASDPAAAAQVPLSAAERALLDARLQEHLDDPAAARPWPEVRAEILKAR